MSCTGSVSAPWETCVCTLQTSGPRIHPRRHRRDGPLSNREQITDHIPSPQEAKVALKRPKGIMDSLCTTMPISHSAEESRRYHPMGDCIK